MYIVLQQVLMVASCFPGLIEPLTDRDDRIMNYVTHLDAELHSTMSELQVTKDDLQSTKSDLEATKRELQTVKSELQMTKSEVDSINSTQRISTAELQADIFELRGNVTDVEMLAHSNHHSIGRCFELIDARTADVAFQVYLTKSMDTGRDQPLKFEGVRHNAGNGYNTTTGKFTAPVSGTYLFSAQFELYKDGAGQRTYFNIVQSNNVVSEGYGYTTTAVLDKTITIIAIISVRVREQVWVDTRDRVRVYGSNNETTLFAGVLLSPH